MALLLRGLHAGRRPRLASVLTCRAPALRFLAPTSAPWVGSTGPRSRHPFESGFTLLELFAAVIIISIVATLAVPAVTKQMRDRRTRAVAERIADQYRTARMRALGRGGAVMIRITSGSASSPGSLEVREAVRGGAATAANSFMPVSSCTLTAWTLADLATATGLTASRRIHRYAVPAGGGAGTVVIDAKTDTSAPEASLSVCFTPMGRAFLSTDGAATWTPLTSVPFAEVYRSSPGGAVIGMPRRVLLLPNGAARVTGVGS